ncbi:hypothetical protein ACFFWA_14670 [Actinomadura verrucosospora]|uniref:hypothetical protein n=1 Tax=Actinomadura verrucosospora TaxID=46165 RepID=UPI0031E95EA6
MAGPYTRSRRAPALACVALTAGAALAACGDGSGTAEPSSPAPSPSSSSSSPGGAPAGETLVLRWRKTGGIAGLGGPGSLPDFSLYSTGRAVASAQGGPTEYRLKPDALRRLLDGARAAGLARSHLVGPGGVADAITIVVAMDGATTRIVQPEAQSGPEARFLQRLDPAAWPPSDLTRKPAPYRPEKTAVLAGPTTGSATVRAWPLEPLGKGVPVAGAICTVAPAAKVPATNPGTAWRSGGQAYSVRLRPLLPAESSCQDVK